MRIKTLLFIISFAIFDLLAQDPLLPHYMTPEEQSLMYAYLNQKLSESKRNTTSPPPGPIRTMAEWEQIQALVITWTSHPIILREIVRNAVKECKVLIITTSEATVTSQLTTAGIPLDSVEFVNTPFNSIWVRDYGPWAVYKNDVDSLFLIDWIYNRPRALDDVTPLAIAEHLNIPIYEATVDPDDFVHTGGNHLPDGMGTAFSSMLVLEENFDKTEDEIDSIAKKYLGVSQYIKFPTLPFDVIHHLDMHMRILDEETIMFGEYPPGVADGPQINANIEYLISEVQTAFGNKFRIVRIPMPPHNGRYPDQGGNYRTYTNSIFLNKTILVPTYEERYDTTALRIYREQLPGYNVVGINCNSIISSLGALHCITKTVGTNNPLLIAHPRLRDSDDAEKEYTVRAMIKHRSGIETAHLFYRTKSDSNYIKAAMVRIDSLTDVWTAIIPPHQSGTEVQYYIRARSNSGKEQVRPIVAPEGYYNFNIYGEPVNQPPFVNIVYPLNGAVFNQDEASLTIDISANDPDGDITHVILYINGDSIATLDAMPFSYSWSFQNAGEYDISVLAVDDKGAQTASEVTSITVENITAIDPSYPESVNLFPNPVEDVLWFTNSDAAFVNVSFTNLYGQKFSLPVVSDDTSGGYNFSDVPSGIYFVSYVVGGMIVTKRIIKL